MAIYEAINCPFRVGDVVRGRKYSGEGVDNDQWRFHHPDVPASPMIVTGIHSCCGGLRSWAMDIDVRCLPYWVDIRCYRNNDRVNIFASSIWVGFLETDPFLTAVARANA